MCFFLIFFVNIQFVNLSTFTHNKVDYWVLDVLFFIQLLQKLSAVGWCIFYGWSVLKNIVVFGSDIIPSNLFVMNCWCCFLDWLAAFFYRSCWCSCCFIDMVWAVHYSLFLGPFELGTYLLEYSWVLIRLSLSHLNFQHLVVQNISLIFIYYQ